ncbi:hypothetical protein MPSEU_000029600 [Mayamaea pseudoterrestris]|nr:hypothetical protein MPSEU_000029600 [Mayamaea pseudoterrestris]
MSNAPYVTNTGNKTKYGQSQPAAAATSYGQQQSSPYGAPSTNAYAPSNTSHIGAYQPSAYGQPSSTSSYGQPSTNFGAPSAPAAATSTYSSTSASSNLPPFSAALSNPAPQMAQPSTTYGAAPSTSTSSYGAPTATFAYGAPSTAGTTYGNSSSTYSPTTTSANKTAYNPYQASAAQQPNQIAVAHATPLSSGATAGAPSHGICTQIGQPIKCHKIDYEIRGTGDLQLVEIILDPGETVIAEAGAMLYLENDVDFKSKLGDGSEPKQGFWKNALMAGGRLLTGESLFVTHFTNTLGGASSGGSSSMYGGGGHSNVASDSANARRVAFAAPYPGTIVALDMLAMQKTTPGLTAIICQKDAFLCAALGTKLSIYLHKRIGTGFFGGEGFILQKLEGDGMVFCHAGGCIIKKELRRGEKLRVDTGCLVAFTHPGIDYSIQMVKGLKSMFFGGEGLFLATLEGEGTVWLQSLPLNKLADKILQGAGARTRNEGGGFSAASFM